MSPRDLLKEPCWEGSDLGEALPDSPHAVSVALPRWQDVVDYEEKKSQCLDSLKSIYPRFGFNPLVAELEKYALRINDSNYVKAWPYPTEEAASLAEHHCKRNKPHGECEIKTILGLPCLLTDAQTSLPAKAFWQHTGLGASSREAAIALGKETAPSTHAVEDSQDALKSRLAEIYQCEKALIQLHPSGMAAFHAALSAVNELFPNKTTLQVGFPYVDVLKLPSVIFKGSTLLLNADEERLIAEIEEKNPSALVVELPSNPMLQCIDLPLVADIAHKRGILVIADDTIGSALNIDALPYADLIFSSLTKSFAGRGDILAGALVVSPQSAWNTEISKRLANQVAILGHADCIALEEASRDVAIRLPKLNNACDQLASRLATHPAVAKVFHPGNCLNFKKLMRNDSGYGCLLSFELIGGLSKAKKFYDSLKVCKGPSLGTSFTLVCPYVLLAHYEELSWAEECGVPEHLIRVSVGLEDSETLWEKFKIALEK